MKVKSCVMSDMRCYAKKKFVSRGSFRSASAFLINVFFSLNVFRNISHCQLDCRFYLQGHGFSAPLINPQIHCLSTHSFHSIVFAQPARWKHNYPPPLKRVHLRIKRITWKRNPLHHPTCSRVFVFIFPYPFVVDSKQTHYNWTTCLWCMKVFNFTCVCVCGGVN